MMEYFNPNDYWKHTGYDPFKDMDDDSRLRITLIHVVIMICAFIAGIELSALIS